MDDTARKRENNRDFYAAIFESSSDSIIVHDVLNISQEFDIFIPINS
jgi:hypothetical protein